MRTSAVPTKQELRRFGLTMGAAIALAFGVVVPWFKGSPLPIWPWLVAAALIGPALALPATLTPVYAAWMRIGYLLSWLISRITLVLVYYVVVVPMGVAMRVLKKDPLARRFERNTETYRVAAATAPRKHLERPF